LTPAAVPEPGTFGLLAAGALGILGLRRRKIVAEPPFHHR
jgi:hypothetical protein